MTNSKQCTRCNKEYPATEEYFRPAKRYRFGLFSWCRSCEQTYHKAHFQKPETKDRHRTYQRERYQAGGTVREKAKENSRQQSKKRYYAAETRENEMERRRAYRNRPEAKQRQAIYNRNYIARPEYKDQARIYRSRRLEKSRVEIQRYHARKNSQPDTLTSSEWGFALEFFGNCCAYCGSQRGFWNPITADHFIPISSHQGMGTTKENILPSCRSCNSSKGNRDAEQWATQKFGKRKAKQILSRISKYFKVIAEVAA